MPTTGAAERTAAPSTEETSAQRARSAGIDGARHRSDHPSAAVCRHHAAPPSPRRPAGGHQAARRSTCAGSYQFRAATSLAAGRPTKCCGSLGVTSYCAGSYQFRAATSLAAGRPTKCCGSLGVTSYLGTHRPGSAMAAASSGDILNRNTDAKAYVGCVQSRVSSITSTREQGKAWAQRRPPLITSSGTNEGLARSRQPALARCAHAPCNVPKTDLFLVVFS